MVQKHLSDPTIEDLLRRSETARRRLGYDLACFKNRLDVPARIKESLQTHPTGWLGGSLVAGLLSSLLLRGRRHERGKKGEERVKKAGLTGLALTAGSALLRPVVKTAVLGYLKRTISSRMKSPDPDR